MANLAILGHQTRGNEVIEILEMLGGKNETHIKSTVKNTFYYINEDSKMYLADKYSDMSSFVIYTIEEFLEKYPYKVGDKVVDMNGLHGTIATMSWDERNCTVIYTLKYEESSINHHGYTAMMLKPYIVDTGCCLFPTTQPSYTLSVGSIKDMKRSIVFSNDSPDETELVLGDNYEVKVKEGKTYVVKKQPKYPKTYEECCNVLGHVTIDEVRGYKDLLLDNLQMLLICRDAYWKIAKNWEYDVNKTEECFYIVNKCGRIVKEHYMNFNHILAFPTEEMRDAFYENFKELIEECKELL